MSKFIKLDGTYSITKNKKGNFILKNQWYKMTIKPRLAKAILKYLQDNE
jgi:hypothetical protein